MNIYLKSLDIKNIMNIIDFKVNFPIPKDSNSFTIITGNNGSGKSCLSAESIYFLIFGKCLRCNKTEDMINIYSDEGTITGEFIIQDNNDYISFTIKRKISRNSQSNVKIEVLECTNENNPLFKEIIELSSITKNNYINNKIQEIFNINQKGFLRVNLHSPYSTNPIPHNQNIISDDILFSLFKEIEEINNLYFKSKKILDTLNLNLLKHNEQLEYLNNLMKEFINGESLTEELINETMKKINDTEINIKNMLDKINRDLEIEIRKFYSIDSNIKNLNNELNKIKNKILNIKKIDICPTCNKKITNEEKNIIFNELNNNINEIKKEINENENKRKRIDDNIKIINHNIEKLKSKLNDINNYKNKMIKKMEDMKYIKNYNVIKKELEDKINDIKEEIKTIEEIYMVFNKKSPYVSRVLFNNIQNILNIFKSLYSLIIGEGVNINIEILDNKIVMSLNGIPYSLLSTSQKKKLELIYIMTIIAYSLIKIKNRRTLNLIILDEFFDNFDPDNTFNILFNIINIKSKTKSQFIITSNYLNSENIESIKNLNENINIISLTN